MTISSLRQTDHLREQLQECEAVYVNSLEHLHLLRDAGLNRSAVVRTASPGLARRLDFPVDRLGQELSSEAILHLLETFDQLSQEVYSRLSDTCSKEMALAIAKTIWSCQRIVYDALLLRHEDNDRPVCIPVVTGTTTPLTHVLSFRWPELRWGENAVVSPEITVNAQKLPYIQPPIARFLQRFRLAEFGQFAFRLQISAAERLSCLPWRGTIYCHRDPELLKDAGLSLLLSRLQLKPIRTPAIQALSRDDQEEARQVFCLVEPLLQSSIANVVDDRNRRRSVRLIAQATEDATARFLAARRMAASILQDNTLPSRAGLASSTIAAPEAIALAEGFRIRNKPVFTFSHGATRTLSQHHDRNPILHETLISDVHFGFSPEEGNGEATGADHVSVGAPAFYRRKPWLSRWHRSRGIWYISSGLYMGGADKLHRAMDDHTQCDFEERIVTEVLARIPHPVVYKPYPSFRYLDPDPVLDAAHEARLTVHESGTDLRYEIHKPELLIVSRSGSTIGYCLCQDKPLVYIEAPGRRLRDEAAQDFENGVFLFSAYDADFLEKLRAFLMLPMVEIQARWAKKKAAREELVRRHICEPVGDGPKRIARRIVVTLNNATAMDKAA